MTLQYLHEIEGNLESVTGEKEKLASLVRFFKELIRDKPKLLKLFIDFIAHTKKIKKSFK